MSFFAILMLLGTGPVQAAEPLKIGFVNTPKVIEQAPQASAARERLKSEFAARDAELVEGQRKLKHLEEKFARDGMIMAESERTKLEREISSLRRDLKRSRDEFSEDFNIRRNEEFTKLQREVAQAVIDIAKEQKFDLILESGVVFASKRVDISQTVLDRLNNASAISK